MNQHFLLVLQIYHKSILVLYTVIIAQNLPFRINSLVRTLNKSISVIVIIIVDVWYKVQLTE